MTKPVSKFGDLSRYAFDRIRQKLSQGDYVSGEELAGALRSFKDHPLPSEIREYIAMCLEGRVRAPRGRPKLPEFEKDRRAALVRYLYRRYLNRIQNRHIREPHEQRYVRRANKDVWRGEPHQIAARLTARRLKVYYPTAELSAGRILNIVSSSGPQK